MASSLVHDSKTGDYILKLTNLLPVVVNMKIDLSLMPVAIGEAILIVLQGEINDEKAKPESSTISVVPEFEYSLPAYSFSVIRMKSK